MGSKRIKKTKDEKHHIIFSGNGTFSVHCFVECGTVTFGSMRGAMSHCPNCGSELGEFQRIQRL